ncbi:unnamed protein product, partial [Ixodes persulcatus]
MAARALCPSEKVTQSISATNLSGDVPHLMRTTSPNDEKAWTRAERKWSSKEPPSSSTRTTTVPSGGPITSMTSRKVCSRTASSTRHTSMSMSATTGL